MDQCVIDEDGSLEVYEDADSKIKIYLTLYNEYASDFNEKKVDNLTLQVLPAPKLSSIEAESSSITLVTDCISSYEDRFCEAEIEIKLYDQYGDKWDGEYELEVSCSNRDIDDEMDGNSGPAYIKENILHLDAEELWNIAEKTPLTFTIKETEINKKTTVKVTLKEPSYESSDSEKIKVNGWSVGAENVEINFDDEDYILSSAVEVFQESKGIPVGLYTDVTILQKTKVTPDKDDNCSVGDVFIMVIGPDNESVPAGGPSKLGAYWDGDCVRVNIAVPGTGNIINCLGTGTYKVKAVRITGVDGDDIDYVTGNASFKVTENISDVKVKRLKDNKSTVYVDDKEDVNSVAEIIAELFVFTKDGKEWTVTEDMVRDVTFTRKEKYIVVKTIELEVPIGDTEYSYLKTIKNVNESVQHGVEE